MTSSQQKTHFQRKSENNNNEVNSNSVEESKMYFKVIANSFSNGEFSKVYPHLAENIIWNVVEENEFVGKEAVIKNCEQVRQYFDSVSTDFKTVNVIADKNKVMVNGTAEFLRDGNSISFVSACDVYEFNDQKQIERITSYCIQKPK